MLYDCSHIVSSIVYIYTYVTDSISMYMDLKITNIFHWRVWWKVTDYCLYRLLGIRVEGNTVEIIFLQVGFHG
jgi:hypothetical protein